MSSSGKDVTRLRALDGAAEAGIVDLFEGDATVALLGCRSVCELDESHLR